MKVIDEAGKHYGKWTVIERAGSDSRGNATWLCECSCGKEAIVTGVFLRDSYTNSHRCLIQELASRLKFIDEIGNQYGRWVVLRRVENDKRGMAMWLCRCSCGNERIVKGSSLRGGNSLSCGCWTREVTSKLKTVDMVGQICGRLTVIRRAGSTHGAVTWLCKCCCGNECVVVGKNLRYGHTKSCGCLVHEMNSLPEGEAAFNAKLRGMKRGARKRGHEWALTREQVATLTKQKCFYCKAEPGQGVSINGIDRVDNGKGYALENVVPCCKHCNMAKYQMTLEEFRAWSRRLYEHFGKQPLDSLDN